VVVTTLVGHAIDGRSRSSIVTVKLQFVVFPARSVAVHVTVVTPFMKVDPDGGTHATVTPGQLSFALAAPYSTLLRLHGPESVVDTIFVEQVIDGGSISLTVTANEHSAVLPELSVATHSTVVIPFAKKEPDAGAHCTVTSPQLSLAFAE